MKFDFDITANPEHRVSEMTEHARNWTETERTAGERKVETMAHGGVCVWLYSEQGQKARTAIVEFRIFALQPTFFCVWLPGRVSFTHGRALPPSPSPSRSRPGLGRLLDIFAEAVASIVLLLALFGV